MVSPMHVQYDSATSRLQHTEKRSIREVDEDSEMIDVDNSESHRLSEELSTYQNWCLQEGQNWRDSNTFGYFLGLVNLDPSLSDLALYPGIQHAAYLALGDYDAPDGCNFELLEPQLQNTMKDILNRIYSSELTEHQFNAGNVVGVRWKAVSQLTGIHRSFNRGVFRVQDVCDPAGTLRIMKTLLSRAMYGDFSAREVDILSSVKHPNILESLDAHIPEGRHETGYMVTELCDKGTLDDLLAKYVKAGLFVPEAFVWEIFKSLVSAVSHLHFGPSKTNQQKSWDPIFHRDIIAGNVFYSSRPANETSGMISQAYPIVKLADFGCALRESEVKTMSLNPDFPYNKGVPVIEPSCEPPEGPFANGPVDIFEIGVLMSDFILVDGFPVTRQPGFQYSSQLRYLVKLCREHNPRMRPNACSLLAGIRRDRQLLSSWGKLAYVELLP
jgi:serine/threonine protein kinase